MSNIVVKVDDLEFHAEAKGDDPVVLDLDLAKRLGYARPIDVRKLVRRLRDDGTLNDYEVIATVAKTSAKGGRPATAYWLRESGALKVMAKSDTPNAIAGLDKMIRAYLTARELLSNPPPAPSEGPSLEGFRDLLSACKSVGENPQWSRDVHCLIKSAADHYFQSWQRMHGHLRKHLGVVSYRRIPVSMLDEAKRFLQSMIYGDNIPSWVSGATRQLLLLPPSPPDKARASRLQKRSCSE